MGAQAASEIPFLIGKAMTGGYRRGTDILHDCTIAVERGQIAVIVGPNGAGKSTAMKAIFGMLRLRSGTVRLAGENITAPPAPGARRKGHGFRAADCKHLHIDDGRGKP